MRHVLGRREVRAKCSEENLEQRDDIEDVNLLGYGLDGWSSNPGTDKMRTRVLSRC
jgi:hypothetical protein